MGEVLGWSMEEQRDYYTMGMCHAMAAAMSRATGLPMGVMWNPLDWHVPPDDDGLGGVHEVVHVYLDCQDGTVLDVMGRRTLDEMKRSMAPYEHEICPCEPLTDQGLSDLMHSSCNLVPIDSSDMDEAMEAVEANPDLLEAMRSAMPSSPSL